MKKTLITIAYLLGIAAIAVVLYVAFEATTLLYGFYKYL